MTRGKPPRPLIYVALLRGINVGGQNLVSMKSLKTSFQELGFGDVSTYINSGNVLFRSTESDARKLAARVDAMLARDYALKPKTVVRSQAEMTSLVRRIDRTWTDDRAWKYNVIFLRHTIDPKRLLADFEIQPEIEQVVCCPGTLLWSARTDAISRTAMLRLGRHPSYQEMTVRNVNTTRKILALMESLSAGART